MKLYVCWTATTAGGHPCGAAHKALTEAGHAPEVVKAYGWTKLPDTPFNLSPGRKRAKELTGSTEVPVLELDDGTAVAGSTAIAAWAQQHPAAA